MNESERNPSLTKAIRPSPENPVENWGTFYERIKKISRTKEEFQSMDFAYDLAKKGHELQKRDTTGERYFEHPHQVALILMDEAGADEASLITSALLHDTVEDTPVFGHTRAKSYDEWSETARYRLGKSFSPKVADTVIALTKPRLDSGEFKNKEEAEAKYLENLETETEKGDPDALLVKMADRLHNLRTLKGIEPAKKQRKIDETKSDYLPLFEKFIQRWEISDQDPEKKAGQMGSVLLAKIKEELTALETG